MSNKEYIGAELHGPFSDNTKTFALSYESKILPYVKVKEIDGKLWIYLDERMAFGSFTEEEIIKLTPALANCMAFSAGYPCFGTDKKYEHFNCEIRHIVLSGKPSLVVDNDKETP